MGVIRSLFMIMEKLYSRSKKFIKNCLPSQNKYLCEKVGDPVNFVLENRKHIIYFGYTISTIKVWLFVFSNTVSSATDTTLTEQHIILPA